MARAEELKAVMSEPPVLLMVKSSIKNRPGTFVSPVASKTGQSSPNPIPKARKKLVGVVPPSTYTTRSKVRG